MFPFMTCSLYLSCPPLLYHNREKNLFSSCETQRVAENRFDFCVIATSEFQRPANSISFTKFTQKCVKCNIIQHKTLCSHLPSYVPASLSLFSNPTPASFIGVQCFDKARFLRDQYFKCFWEIFRNRKILRKNCFVRL